MSAALAAKRSKGSSRTTMLPVSERALRLRINRAHKDSGDVLRRCPENSRWYRDLGRYYVTNHNKVIVSQNIDLEDYARELGVLKPYEKLED